MSCSSTRKPSFSRSEAARQAAPGRAGRVPRPLTGAAAGQNGTGLSRHVPAPSTCSRPGRPRPRGAPPGSSRGPRSRRIRRPRRRPAGRDDAAGRPSDGLAGDGESRLSVTERSPSGTGRTCPSAIAVGLLLGGLCDRHAVHGQGHVPALRRDPRRAGAVGAEPRARLPSASTCRWCRSRPAARDGRAGLLDTGPATRWPRCAADRHRGAGLAAAARRGRLRPGRHRRRFRADLPAAAGRPSSP